MSIKKYSSDSWVTVPYRKYETATDTITSLPKTIIGDGQPISAYTIKGNMSQSGTPTPSNPVYPQETGDKTANLSLVTQDNAITYSSNFNKYAIANNVVTCTGNAYMGFIVKVNPNTAYTVQGDADELGIRMQVMEFSAKPVDFSTNLIQTSYNTYMSISKTGSITTTATTEYVLFAFYNDKPTNRIFNIMMSEGATVPSYEPYGYKIPILSNGVSYPIYLSEPIRKIGDSVDTAPSSGTANRVIKKVILTGSEDYGVTGEETDNAFFYTDLEACKDATSLMSTHFQVTTVYSTNTNIGIRMSEVSTMGFIRLRIRPNNVSTMSTQDFKTWLANQYAAGTPVTVYYVLATATTESFTAPSIPTSGTAQTFDVDTSLKPSEVSLTWHGWHEHSDTKYTTP